MTHYQDNNSHPYSFVQKFLASTVPVEDDPVRAPIKHPRKRCFSAGLSF